MYNLSEDMEMKAKVAAMARKIEEMELRKVHEVQAISEPQQQANPCSICQSFEHMVEECPPFQQQEKCSGNKLTWLANGSQIQMLPMATRTTLAGGTTQTLHGSQGQTHISHQPNQANRVKVNPQLSKHS